MESAVSSQRGLTLVELLVVVAIVGALSFAVPGFVSFFQQQQLTSAANEFVLSIAYARSESVRRGATVSLQATASQGSTDEFGQGWCVVVGTPGDCDTPANVLRTSGDTNVRFDATGDLDEVVALSFDGSGLLTNAVSGNTDIIVCAANEARGRRISVTAIGRTRVAEATAAELGCDAE